MSHSKSSSATNKILDCHDHASIQIAFAEVSSIINKEARFNWFYIELFYIYEYFYTWIILQVDPATGVMTGAKKQFCLCGSVRFRVSFFYNLYVIKLRNHFISFK